MRTFDIDYETQDSNDYDYDIQEENYDFEDTLGEESFEEIEPDFEPRSPVADQCALYLEEVEKDMQELERLEKEGKLSYDVQVPKAEKKVEKTKTVSAPKRQVEDPRVIELKAWALSKGFSIEQFPIGSIEDLYTEMKIQMEFDAKEAAKAKKELEPETAQGYKPRANQRQVVNAKGKLQGIKKLAPLPEKKKREIEVVPKVEVVYQPSIDFEEAESFEFAPKAKEPEPVPEPIKTELTMSEPKKLLVNPKAEAKAEVRIALAKEAAKEKTVAKEDQWQTVTKPKKVEKPKQYTVPQPRNDSHTPPHRFTRMCRSVLEGVKCRHHTCLFAHDVKQLAPVPCRFGCECNFVRKSATVGVYENTKPSIRVCSFWHPKETHESFGRRQGYPISSQQRSNFATPKKL